MPYIPKLQYVVHLTPPERHTPFRIHLIGSKAAQVRLGRRKGKQRGAPKQSRNYLHYRDLT